MFEFTIAGTQGAARAATLTLPHGPVPTPAFMPVGTYGAVRGLRKPTHWANIVWASGMSDGNVFDPSTLGN